MTRYQDFSEFLSKLDSEGRLRSIPSEVAPNKIDLLSNDYLGLGAKAQEFLPEFQERFGNAPFSSSASRLLSRQQHWHSMLEQKLEELYGRPALLFNSGYHANVGVLTALLTLPDTLVIADKLIHASAIDALQMSHAEWQRFRHNDINSLRRLMEKNIHRRRIIVAVEAVYSMDGDLAPLSQLVSIREEFPNMILYVDEAHGFGVFGNRGLGLCEALGISDKIDIIMGTLGKAAASASAFIVTAPELRDFLINCSRSFIFSTALPPAQQAWSLLMIEKIVGMQKSVCI